MCKTREIVLLYVNCYIFQSIIVRGELLFYFYSKQFPTIQYPWERNFQNSGTTFPYGHLRVTYEILSKYCPFVISLTRRFMHHSTANIIEKAQMFCGRKTMKKGPLKVVPCIYNTKTSVTNICYSPAVWITD